MTDCYLIKASLSSQFELHLLLKNLFRVRHDDKLNKGSGTHNASKDSHHKIILPLLTYYMVLWTKDTLDDPLACPSID